MNGSAYKANTQTKGIHFMFDIKLGNILMFKCHATFSNKQMTSEMSADPQEIMCKATQNWSQKCPKK